MLLLMQKKKQGGLWLLGQWCYVGQQQTCTVMCLLEAATMDMDLDKSSGEKRAANDPWTTFLF